MAMKKAEMEEHCRVYRSEMLTASRAEQAGLYYEAIKGAKRAWNYIDGMLQYEKRYGDKQFSTISAIEIVLRYAPLLFDYESLNALEELLKTYKRIDRDTTHDMGGKLEQARERMWGNRKLWAHLEEHAESRQADLNQVLGGDQDYWRSVAEVWERMGLLRRVKDANTYRLTLITRMDAIISAKCPNCGRSAVAPKAMFLERTKCFNCSASVSFVLMLTSNVEL